MAFYIPDILYPLPPFLPANLEGEYDHPFVIGEEFQVQRGCQSRKASQVVRDEPSACLYASLGPQLFSELNHRPQTPISWKQQKQIKKENPFYFSLDLLSGPGSTPSQSCLSLFSVTSSSRLHDPTCLWPSLTRTLPALFPHPAHFCPLSSSLLSLSGYLASFLLRILHILYIPSHFSLQPSYHHVNLVPFPLFYEKQSSAVVVLVVLESF